jgi:hypothetical protein
MLLAATAEVKKQETGENYILTSFILFRHSVVTIYGICNVISHEECSVLLHQYFPKCVFSAQYGCFLYFLDFVLSSMFSGLF